MKALVLGIVLSFATNSYAASLRNCQIIKDKVAIPQVSGFSITNFETTHPESSIDGGLFDFTEADGKVKMSFSNECDNMYEFTFSKVSIERATKGIYQKLIGRADVADAGYEVETIGVVSCDVEL